MGSITVNEMQALEAAAIACGWTEEQLLDLAGIGLGRAIGRYVPSAGTAIVYLGKGHNAGDALVAARILRDCFGWEIGLRCAFPRHQMAPLAIKKWEELGIPSILEGEPALPLDRGRLILIDGLLGSGARGPLRPPLAPLADEMVRLRNHYGARILAVDCPSGMDLDTGEAFPGTVVADVTFMIGSAKVGLLNGSAAGHVGALALVPIPVLASPQPSAMELIAPQTQPFGKCLRPFEYHKGLAGRVAILAGSRHYTGAAVLAATGALKGGAGLITLYVPSAIAEIVSSKCPPEIIVQGLDHPTDLQKQRFDALVVGCGMGNADDGWMQSLLNLIVDTPTPAVIDADALNWIAKSENLSTLKERHLITPHPGEFKRLAPDLADLPREQAVTEFASRFPGILLLKGCRTLISKIDHPLRVNSTGSPGMASGGQGDLLAGVIGALLARGNSPFDAASLGAWICGRAAEVALNQPGISEESLLASDTADFLGTAFEDWRTCRR